MNKKAKIGAGLIAASAVAAAGYYFYGSKEAKKHRGAAVTWGSEMRKEIGKEVAQLKKLSPEDFAKVADTLAGIYAQNKKTVSKVKKTLKKRP